MTEGKERRLRSSPVGLITHKLYFVGIFTNIQRQTFLKWQFTISHLKKNQQKYKKRMIKMMIAMRILEAIATSNALQPNVVLFDKDVERLD